MAAVNMFFSFWSNGDNEGAIEAKQVKFSTELQT
jgi:hypothetical protein